MVKRRRLLQSVMAAPAAAALVPPVAAQYSGTADQTPRLETSAAHAAGTGVRRFFSEPQFAALRHLASIVIPAYNGKPSAIEAGSVEFADFYLSKSSPTDQRLWSDGLDALNAAAQTAHAKPFAALTPAQAGPILAPLRSNHGYDGPSDPTARFLIAARDFLLQATLNSAEYAEAGPRRRGSAGTSFYWLPTE